MKTIVIYQSKTGFSRKYAEWIAKALSADLAPLKKVKPEQVQLYDTIIFGGGLYQVGINGIKFVKKNLPGWSGKKVVVFATGATPGRPETVESVRNHNFTAAEQQKISFFYLRGGFNFRKLGLIDKFLMLLLKLKLKSKKQLQPDERGMLAAYSQPADFTRKSNIGPLLNSLTEQDAK